MYKIFIFIILCALTILQVEIQMRLQSKSHHMKIQLPNFILGRSSLKPFPLTSIFMLFYGGVRGVGCALLLLCLLSALFDSDDHSHLSHKLSAVPALIFLLLHLSWLNLIISYVCSLLCSISCIYPS